MFKKVKFLAIINVCLSAVIALFTTSSAAKAQTSEFSLYANSELGVSFEYPASWKLETYDNVSNPRAYGISYILHPSDQSLPDIVIGLHTVRRVKEQSLEDWFDDFTLLSALEPVSYNDLQLIEKRRVELSEAFDGATIQALEAFDGYATYVNIPYGETVWYIFAKKEMSHTEEFNTIVRSFHLQANAPTTLEEAFGPAFQPNWNFKPVFLTEEDYYSSQLTVSGSLSRPSLVASLPDGYWYAPIPSGYTWIALCGSPEHEEASSYAIDISKATDNTALGHRSAYNSHSGWVVYAGQFTDPYTQSGYGILVKVESEVNPYVYYAYYAHLEPNSLAVSQGNYINARTVVGTVGTSGTYPNGTPNYHLHFHVEAYGLPVSLANLNTFNENSGYPTTGECGTVTYP